MKREELIEKGYTQEQVTDILNMFHSTNQQNTNLQTQVNGMKDIEEKYQTAQKELDEIKKAQMTEQQKFEADKLEIEKNLKESRIIVNKAVAKEILAGYDIDDELIAKMVDENKDVTISSANLLKSKLDSLAEITEKKTKEELSKLNVKPNPTNVLTDDSIMTKEKFDNMSMTQQKEWKNANIDKYHEWYPQN